MSPASKRLSLLRDRAFMLQKARQFFSERGIIEVDCPILSDSAAVDAHIDLIEASPAVSSVRYLHSSPEYGMKRLLSEGIGDIYQLSHVFRDGEYGTRHNPEFMMAEWYRVGMSFHELMQETALFIQLFVGDLPIEIISYKEAFLMYCGLDPFSATPQQLREHLACVLVDQPLMETYSKDDLLNQILALQVEPQLGKSKLTLFAYYPPTQAALAKTENVDGNLVALRFEAYCEGVELANGYLELQDPDEQLRRFEQANAQRKEMNKKELPIDFRFLDALRKGLPACSGVAVGFDRLMMLRHRQKTVASVIPFEWPIA